MWKIIDNYNWDNIRSKFDWVRDMADVPQNPVYHAEGNVEIHTRMVLEALLSLPEYQALSEQKQHILAASALLHDVEKRSTTVRQPDGRLTSHGHAKKGEFTARRLLYQQIPTPFIIRETVAKLVRYHGLPLWALDKPNPQKAVIQASLEVDTYMLAILAKADVMGRICQDADDLFYRIELFKSLCEENDCLGKPKQFKSPVARWHYFNKEEASPDYDVFDDTKFEVVVMSALPGSGKDTYLQQHLSDWPVVSPDQIRRAMRIKPTDKSGNGKVIQQAKEEARVLMRKQQSFVWNATNITKQMRSQLVDSFRAYGAYVKVIYVEVPYPELVKQNGNREHIVPIDVMQKMVGKLEVPSPVEAHEVDYCIRED
ncbi:MAG: AAA family ATPase [Bacteroidota bacterium]